MGKNIKEDFEKFYKSRVPASRYGLDFINSYINPTIIENQIGSLIKTLWFYIEMAEITEVQREILDLKMKHVCNQDIAFTINKKWGKSYTTNYISTIFH